MPSFSGKLPVYPKKRSLINSVAADLLGKEDPKNAKKKSRTLVILQPNRPRI